MKKQILMLAASLFASHALFAEGTVKTGDAVNQGIDYELFLKPFIEKATAFDKAFLINAQETASLFEHFNELARDLNAEDQIIVAAPASFATLFTDGSQSDEMVRQHISHVLAKIGKSSDPALITKQLSELKEVMRATFVHEDGLLKLVTHEKMLKKGEAVWCKIPNGVISTTYHSEEEYLIAMNQASLKCQEIKRPCFFGRVKYNMWHKETGKSLGEAYLMHNPFTIYSLVKKA